MPGSSAAASFCSIHLSSSAGRREPITLLTSLIDTLPARIRRPIRALTASSGAMLASWHIRSSNSAAERTAASRLLGRETTGMAAGHHCFGAGGAGRLLPSSTMPSIQKRTSKTGAVSYRVRIKIHGQVVSATFPRLAEARRWGLSEEARLRTARRNAALVATLDDAVAAYREDEVPRLSAAWAKRLARMLAWWSARLGGVKLADLDAASIALHLRKLQVSGATQNRYQAALSVVLSYAAKTLRWIDHNPALLVRRRPEGPGRLRWLEAAEVRRLLAACRRQDPILELLVLLAVTTGARHGELLDLRWRDLDLEAGTAHVRQSKSGTRRILELPSEAVEALQNIRAGWPPDHDAPLFQGNDLVHVSRGGGRWKRALEEAGIDDFTFHGLRHTFASHLAMAGATVPEIAAALGHKSFAMASIYSHLAPSHGRDLRRSVAEGLLGGPPASPPADPPARPCRSSRSRTTG